MQIDRPAVGAHERVRVAQGAQPVAVAVDARVAEPHEHTFGAGPVAEGHEHIGVGVGALPDVVIEPVREGPALEQHGLDPRRLQGASRLSSRDVETREGRQNPGARVARRRQVHGSQGPCQPPKRATSSSACAGPHEPGL